MILEITWGVNIVPVKSPEVVYEFVRLYFNKSQVYVLLGNATSLEEKFATISLCMSPNQCRCLLVCQLKMRNDIRDCNSVLIWIHKFPNSLRKI